MQTTSVIDLTTHPRRSATRTTRRPPVGRGERNASATGRGPERRARDVANLDAPAAAVRRTAAAWALAHGRSIDFDALTVIIACTPAAAPTPTFTEDDVWRLWWVELAQWCGDRGVAVPEAVAATMYALFDHLEATDGFGPGSDPLDQLLDAMEGAGALWRGGRSPAGAG